jgi:ankyrin repeat protein
MLVRAVREANYREVEKLLRKESPNVIDRGYTPLGTASLRGMTRMVSLLLDKGALPNFADAEGRTPLTLAIERGYADIARLLISRGANPNMKGHNGYTPLMIAVLFNRLEIASYLLDIDVDISIKNRYGNDVYQIPMSEEMKELLLSPRIRSMLYTRNRSETYMSPSYTDTDIRFA